MTYKPLVSIITPTYNHERFIQQCIESVLAQTYTNWEQIIIDDGSTDRTGEMVARFKDPRIKYIKQDNVGIWKLGQTYNKALQQAKGELIAILEGDDFWPSDKLEIQVPAFHKKEIVLCYGKFGIADSHGEIIEIKPDKLDPSISRGMLLRQMLVQNPIAACTVICRKQALNSLGGFIQPSNTPYVDGSTWLNLSLLGEFYGVEEITGYWRKHEGQVTTQMRAEMVEASKYGIEFFSRLPKEVQESTGLAIEDLWTNLERKRETIYLLSGRASLGEQRWDDAKDYFVKAFRSSRLSTRLKAALGLMCSYGRINVEKIPAFGKISSLIEKI
jgi:glycosyltransferase involved in cell wall biosynthesis